MNPLAGTATFQAENGSFTVDRNSSVRRNGTLEFIATPALIPAQAGDLLTPFNTTVIPSFGINYGDGTQELIPMGTFVLTDSTFSETSSNLTGAMSLEDLAYAVGVRAFLTPYQVASTSPQTAIQAILDLTYPGLTLNMVSTTITIPTPLPSFSEGSNPWDACVSIAASVGFEMFFDVMGNPTCRPVPDPTTIAPIWTFGGGSPGANKLDHKWTRKGISNDFIVSGSSSIVQPPVRNEAAIFDPRNPMSVSRFGDVPTFISSTIIATSGAALDLANAELTKATGLAESLSFECLPNPAWDVNDVVKIVDPKLKINGTYIVDTVTVGFSINAPTQITARRVG